MNNLILAIMLISSICLPLSGKEKTKRNSLVSKSEIQALLNATECDSLAFSERIILSGYSKTISDRNETFYVTNNTPFRISRLIIVMHYTNMKEEMIHNHEYNIICDIPSGETRQVAVKSFDSQHTHYYYKSRKPRRSAIPYKVKFSIKRYDVAIEIK